MSTSHTITTIVGQTAVEYKACKKTQGVCCHVLISASKPNGVINFCPGRSNPYKLCSIRHNNANLPYSTNTVRGLTRLTHVGLTGTWM